MALPPIRVKFLSRLDPREWLRYFPREDGRWEGCEFIFARDARDYDWLVVYDDIPAAAGQSRNSAGEEIACPRENTLLVTTEPASIKTYGRGFAAQFGHVLTSQPAWALPHTDRHFQQAANHWFFGSGNGHWLSRTDLVQGPALEDKTQAISVVYSPKRQWHTLHARRFRFIEAMRSLLPEIIVFGRGARPMDDKAEALAPFRYHLAVENHIGLHHLTEKLTDAFLGRCLPFYAGAPNAAEYFPADSFIPIDIRDPVAAARVIREAIREDAWTKRLPAIEEARRRVLEEQHLFAVLCRLISDSKTSNTCLHENDGSILGRHAWRKQHKIGGVAHVLEKLYVRGRSLFGKRVA
ncbi:MAG: glycosyltransferase family 10 [Thiobacillus sp.]|nr:glycosyltransferase family 10 [Thiobacillus sp.]MDP2977992.1 glycosyltransferase family 10 [Thiobacillus sp.]